MYEIDFITLVNFCKYPFETQTTQQIDNQCDEIYFIENISDRSLISYTSSN